MTPSKTTNQGNQSKISPVEPLTEKDKRGGEKFIPLLDTSNREILSDNPSDYNLPGEKWYPNQKRAVEKALLLDDGKFLFLESPTGCHAPGQGILMYDGSVKKVEDVVVGDQLMGPDSKSRDVLSLVRGSGQMVEVTPIKGDPFVINLDHVLSLQRISTKYKTGEIIDVSVREWVDWPDWRKYIYKLFRIPHGIPQQKKDVLRTGFSIEHVGEGEYYGFLLSGDGRYLMDDFTVTHNSGKSFAPALVSRFRPATVMVATRDLQRQYEESFDWFKVVWGQAHYECILPSKVEMYDKAYSEVPTRQDCTINIRRGSCPVASECPYEVAKREAANSRAAVLNYAYGYYTYWWRKPNPGDVFCDEAHRLPDILADLISIEISDRQKKEYSLPEFPLVSGGSGRAIDIIRGYLEKCMKALNDWQDLAKSIGGDEKQMLRWDRFRTKVESLQDALSVAEPDTWYMASGESLGRLIARPIFPRQYASRILDPSSRAAVLMSATIGKPNILAARLGISKEDVSFVTLPHSFPKKNRPVIWIKNSPSISSKSGPRDYKHQADVISNLLDGMEDKRGIIHCTSWYHTNLLCKLLAKRGHEDRLFNTKGPRVRMVKRFKNSPPGTVAVSPSWAEGLDFPDEEARFAIIAKIPWRSLGDPVTRLRLNSEGGREWYDWTACLGVVQRAGRVVRHMNDWGITYIVDSNWRRVKRLAPQWFEVTEV